MEFPEVFVSENAKEALSLKDKFKRNELVKKITSENFKGVVDKDGKWGATLQGQILSPGGGWDITKSVDGRYKVTHMQGYYNISLSVSALQSPGTIQVIENHPTYFIVQTSINGKPYDMPFAFTLTRVVSLSDQPDPSPLQRSFSPGTSP